MTLYEAVYTRKSIRNFRKDKVETSILEGMIQFYHEMEPLFPGIETSIELIDTQGSKKAKSRLGGIINVAAPYYLVIYTEDKERADMNAGYIMQQISLYLFSKGVGSCFQGMGHLKGEMPKEGMRCVILMAIGYPKVDMVRNQEDAKRESMEDLCAVKEPPRRFVKEFLEQEKSKGTKMCILTASEADYIHLALNRLELLPYFEFVATCTEVGASKDSPKVFQMMMERLGGTLEDTIVFEDAYYAIKSAKDGGFTVYAIADPTSDSEKQAISSTADRYIQSYEELL